MKYFTIIFILFFLFISTSTAQLPWTKDANNPVMSGGASGSWDRHVSVPSVLYNPDSARYEMWFMASDGPPSWDPYWIGYATSEDGLNWARLDTAVLKPSPGSWDEKTVMVGRVIREDGAYKMWYTGFSNTDDRGKIGYATSADGIRWTKYQGNPVMEPVATAWEAGGSAYGTIMPVDDGYKMWYSGFNASQTKSHIGYATSPDGISWTRADSVNPVLSPGSVISWDDAFVYGTPVHYINNMYHMWYSGTRVTDNPRQTGYAISVDGIHWTKYNDPATTFISYSKSDPVLKPSGGQWDGNYAQATAFRVEGDTLRMWYQGSRTSTATNLWRIGHATAPLSMIFVPQQYATIQQAIDVAHDGNIILVEDGTYYENINFKGKALTVASYFYFDGDTSHISKTIIDGSQPANPDSGSVVYLESGEDSTSVLMGFTITNGSGTIATYTIDGETNDARFGGGIYCVNSGGRFVANKIINNSLTSEYVTIGGGLSAGDFGSDAYVILENNQILYNTMNSEAYATGGAIALTCNGRIVNNIISNNSCYSTGDESAGGGIRTATSSGYPRTVLIKGNTITHNIAKGKGTVPTYYWAARGGGIMNTDTKVLVLNNEISYNLLDEIETGTASGGGIYMYLAGNGSVVSGNKFYKNKNDIKGKNFGGGMSLASCDPSVINNIVNENSAMLGGGLYFTYSSSEVINNTIVKNTGSTRGGGLFSEAANPVVINSIIWDNEASIGPQIGGNFQVRYSDIQGGYEGLGNLNADPYFADNLFNLSDSSKCVGNGSDSVKINNSWYKCPSRDYNGGRRPYPWADEFVDMGAIESHFERVEIVNTLEFENLPIKFALSQNYPNPFNPKTIINYELPITNYVNLSIYNLLGQKVATLVDKKQPSGSYKVQWDATNFSSGIYIYQLRVNNQKQKAVFTKKLILLK